MHSHMHLHSDKNEKNIAYIHSYRHHSKSISAFTWCLPTNFKPLSLILTLSSGLVNYFSETFFRQRPSPRDWSHKFQSFPNKDSFLRIGPNFLQIFFKQDLMWSKVSIFTFQHMTVCVPLLCNGLDLTFTFQHVTVCGSLLCNDLNLTFIFLHMMVHGPLLCNGHDLTFPFLIFQKVTSLLENNPDT